jgi:hypothetical protein
MHTGKLGCTLNNEPGQLKPILKNKISPNHHWKGNPKTALICQSLNFTKIKEKPKNFRENLE